MEAGAEAIEKQCRRLESQKRAIQDIISRNVAAPQPRTIGSTHAKASLDFEHAESLASLRGRLQTSMRQSDAASQTLPTDVDRLLEKDDRLLDGLEKVLGQLASPAQRDSAEEVQRLCQALTTQMSADIHLQLDQVYHTAAAKYQRRSASSNQSEELSDNVQQKQSLQSELDELCREIDSLSAMAVDTQFKQPTLRALQSAQSDEDHAKASWSGYLAAVFQYLTARLEVAHDHFQHSHHHRAALTTISSALETVLASGVEAQQTSQHSPVKSSAKGLKPLRLVQANLSENQDPIVQLLRMLDVRAADPTDPAKLGESLEKAVKEHQKKLDALSTKSEEGVAEQVSRSLALANSDSAALLGAVYSPTRFGQPRVLTAETQAGIDQLEESTREIGNHMRGLNVDAVAATVRERQQALLQRLRD